MTVTIRAYTEADWNAVCRVHDAARPDELAGACDPRAFVPLADDPEAEALRSARILVAEQDGTVVGFAAVDGDYLSFLYVHPDHYRKGLGRRLLRAALALAEGEPWTIVLAQNTPAAELYRREGFSVVDTFESDNEGYPVTCLRLARRTDKQG